MYHNFFIHSSVDGRPGCFYVLAIVNSAAVNNGIHVFFFNFGFFRVNQFFSKSVSSVLVPRSGIAGSYGGFIPRFLRNLHTIFHSGCINLHFHQQHKSIPFSSPAFIVCRLFNGAQSAQYEVISHCSFDLHLSNNEWC